MEGSRAQTERTSSKMDDSLAKAVWLLSLQDRQPGDSLLKAAGRSESQDARYSSASDTSSEASSVFEPEEASLEEDIFEYITSFAKNHNYEKEVMVLDEIIRHITRKVINDFHDPKEALWRVVESCYIESTSVKGGLYLSNNDSMLNRGIPENLFDPARRAKLREEHQYQLRHIHTQLQLGESLRKNTKEAEGWIRFWMQMLSSCPNGPTLSDASTHPSFDCDFAKVPKYLFRAFDGNISYRRQRKGHIFPPECIRQLRLGQEGYALARGEFCRKNALRPFGPCPEKRQLGRMARPRFR